MTNLFRVLRIVSSAIIAGFVADDLGASTYTSFGVGTLTGILLLTILEAGAWKDDE